MSRVRSATRTSFRKSETSATQRSEPFTKPSKRFLVATESRMKIKDKDFYENQLEKDRALPRRRVRALPPLDAVVRAGRRRQIREMGSSDDSARLDERGSDQSDGRSSARLDELLPAEYRRSRRDPRRFARRPQGRLSDRHESVAPPYPWLDRKRLLRRRNLRVPDERRSGSL